MFDASNAFRVSIFALVSLSACMVAVAEEAVFPGALTIPLALLAYFLAERRKTLRLSALWANLLALLALAFAGGEWLLAESTVELESVKLSRLLAGTHLLVYLAWIVLYLEKAGRHYWWMLALSVLQVAVGAVLTNAGIYGLLLFTYLVAAIWTLSLFTVRQARARAEPEPVEGGSRPGNGQFPGPVSSPRAGGMTGASAAGRSGVQSGRSVLAPIVQFSSVVPDPNARSSSEFRVGGRFIAGTLGTALASVGVAIFFFLLVPRVWIGRLPIVRGNMGRASSVRFTGFSNEVELGSMGRILESTERVLFVRMYDSEGNELDVQKYAAGLGYDEPLFRGAVLGTYKDGRWDAGAMGEERLDDFTADQRAGVVRQEYRLKPLGTSYLFAMQPVFGCDLSESAEGRIGYQRFSSMMLRPDTVSGNAAVEYVAHSPARTNGLRPPQIPSPSQNSRFARRQRERERWEQCERFPDENPRLSRLKSLARSVSGYDDPVGNRPSDSEMARRLVAHLRDSGRYQYSLDSSLANAEDDPVEDFLFNRKQGHCEYYASALALMLRAVGIPSRLVSGFKGGETNRLNGEFYVEQRHAHAWVEAYIDGSWVTLDATPAARSESVAELAPALLSLDDFFNLFRDNWQDYFVGMNVKRQQQQFYDPLLRSIRTSHSSRERAAGSLRELFTSPRKWFSWQGAVATLIVLLLLSGAVWLVRRLRCIGSRSGRSANLRRTARQVRVDFYERFRAICGRRGMSRGEAQTEREFSAAVSQAMNDALAAAGLGRLPAELVETFYGVRFGRELLEPVVEKQIDAKLNELERALRRDPDNRPNDPQASRP